MVLTIFIVSFFVITTLVVIKMYEVKKNSKTSITKKLSTYDDVVSAHLDEVRDVSIDNINKASVFVKKELPRKTKENIAILKGAVKEKYQAVLPNIRGIRVLNQKGKVSQFLQDIQHDRDRVGKGRIEDFLT
jgi:hypothetical protein